MALEPQSSKPYLRHMQAGALFACRRSSTLSTAPAALQPVVTQGLGPNPHLFEDTGLQRMKPSPQCALALQCTTITAGSWLSQSRGLAIPEHTMAYGRWPPCARACASSV